MPKLVPWLGISATVLILDLLTKYWVTQILAPGQSVRVTSFFNLVLVFNSGAAFSLFADAAGWQRVFFTSIALVAAVIIVHLLRRHAQQCVFSLALSMILGGALGNVWDRITQGHVVDFLHFHYQGYYWPAFNAADSAISVGVLLLIWDSFRKPRARG
ncbi:MAG: signal peptidase II [Burkholderiales bacterium]